MRDTFKPRSKCIVWWLVSHFSYVKQIPNTHKTQHVRDDNIKYREHFILSVYTRMSAIRTRLKTLWSQRWSSFPLMLQEECVTTMWMPCACVLFLGGKKKNWKEACWEKYTVKNASCLNCCLTRLNTLLYTRIVSCDTSFC